MRQPSVLSAQQDLRNAATLIVRDARMAGNFGCFNMAVNSSSAVISDKTEKNPFFALKKGNFG